MKKRSYKIQSIMYPSFPRTAKALKEIEHAKLKNNELIRLLDSLRYWEGISFCECKSNLPSGGCLKCDCRRGIETIAKLITVGANQC